MTKQPKESVKESSVSRHTLTPWEYWKMNDGSWGIGHIYPKDRACVDIASRKIDSKDDAEFIVRAVNSFDKNQETIKALGKALKWYHLEGQDVRLHRKAVPNCSDCNLIALAEEGE